MLNIIKASLYKLFKDWTFRITMIVGVGLAGLMLGLNAALESLNGQNMLLSSVSPSQNFGLTVPINLIVFTIGEFTYGTIRNKIIAGHSKFKVYVGLFLTGFIFTIILMSVYLGLMVGISSAIGGFDIKAFGETHFILCFIIYFLCSYLFVTALSIFFGTLFRNIGGSISLVVIILVVLGMLPLLFALGKGRGFTTENLMMWFNPLYMLGLYTNASSIVNLLREMGIDTSSFFNQSPQIIAAGIVTPFYWAVIFFVAGAAIFKRRDVK